MMILPTSNGFGAPLNDICDGTCKHLQTLGHLQGNHSGIILSNMMDGLVDLKRII
jgi:hypothetical protein